MKVTKIINDNVNSGANWSQSSVQLDDGQIVRIFNPVQTGDTVESFINGKYTNWRIKKVISNDTEKVINSMSKDIQTLLQRLDKLESKVTELEQFNIKESNSQVSEVNEMPEDFLKI